MDRMSKCSSLNTFTLNNCVTLKRRCLLGAPIRALLLKVSLDLEEQCPGSV